MKLRVLVPPDTPHNTVLVNTVTLQSGTAPSVSAESRLRVSRLPRLHLTKSGPATAVPGGTITYSLSYSNTGNGEGTGAQIVDTLPDHTSFVAASNGGVFDAGANTVTWDLGTLDPGAQGAVTLDVAVAVGLTEGTVLTNTARLRSTEVGPVAAQETTTVSCTPTLEVAPTVTGVWEVDTHAIVTALPDGGYLAETTYPADVRIRIYRLRLCNAGELKAVSLAIPRPGTLAIEFRPAPILEFTSSLPGTWQVDPQASVTALPDGGYLAETTYPTDTRMRIYRLRLNRATAIEAVSTTVLGPGAVVIEFQPVNP